MLYNKSCFLYISFFFVNEKRGGGCFRFLDMYAMEIWDKHSSINLSIIYLSLCLERLCRLRINNQINTPNPKLSPCCQFNYYLKDTVKFDGRHNVVLQCNFTARTKENALTLRTQRSQSCFYPVIRQLL